MNFCLLFDAYSDALHTIIAFGGISQELSGDQFGVLYHYIEVSWYLNLFKWYRSACVWMIWWNMSPFHSFEARFGPHRCEIIVITWAKWSGVIIDISMTSPNIIVVTVTLLSICSIRFAAVTTLLHRMRIFSSQGMSHQRIRDNIVDSNNVTTVNFD